MLHFQRMTRRQAKNNTVINLCGFVSHEVSNLSFNNQSKTPANQADGITLPNRIIRSNRTFINMQGVLDCVPYNKGHLAVLYRHLQDDIINMKSYQEAESKITRNLVATMKRPGRSNYNTVIRPIRRV